MRQISTHSHYISAIVVMMMVVSSRQQNAFDYQPKLRPRLTPEQEQQMLQLHYIVSGISSAGQQLQLTAEQRQFLEFLQRYLYGSQQQQQLQQQQRVDVLRQLADETASPTPGISISTILHDPSAPGGLAGQVPVGLRNLPYQNVDNLVARLPPNLRPPLAQPPTLGGEFGGGFLPRDSPIIDPYDPRYSQSFGGLPPPSLYGYPLRNFATTVAFSKWSTLTILALMITVQICRNALHF